MTLLCRHGTISLAILARPRDLGVGGLLTTPPDLLSGCKARPPCFDIFSFSSLCFLFLWLFPPAVLFLCLFGFPDVAATGYFGSYLGLTRSGEVVVGKTMEKSYPGGRKIPYMFPRLGNGPETWILSQTDWDSHMRHGHFN